MDNKQLAYKQDKQRVLSSLYVNNASEQIRNETMDIWDRYTVYQKNIVMPNPYSAPLFSSYSEEENG